MGTSDSLCPTPLGILCLYIMINITYRMNAGCGDGSERRWLGRGGRRVMARRSDPRCVMRVACANERDSRIRATLRRLMPANPGLTIQKANGSGILLRQGLGNWIHFAHQFLVSVFLRLFAENRAYLRLIKNFFSPKRTLNKEQT